MALGAPSSGLLHRLLLGAQTERCCSPVSSKRWLGSDRFLPVGNDGCTCSGQDSNLHGDFAPADFKALSIWHGRRPRSPTITKTSAPVQPGTRVITCFGE